MSLKDIRNLDYTILLCRKMEETRAFYKDVMGFPIERDLENWVSFRLGATLLTLRPRGPCLVWDDGPAISGSAATSLRSACHHPPSTPVTPSWWPRASPSSASRPIFLPGATGRCSSAIPRTM